MEAEWICPKCEYDNCHNNNICPRCEISKTKLSFYDLAGADWSRNGIPKREYIEPGTTRRNYFQRSDRERLSDVLDSGFTWNNEFITKPTPSIWDDEMNKAPAPSILTNELNKAPAPSIWNNELNKAPAPSIVDPDGFKRYRKRVPIENTAERIYKSRHSHRYFYDTDSEGEPDSEMEIEPQSKYFTRNRRRRKNLDKWLSGSGESDYDDDFILNEKSEAMEA